MTRRVVRRVVVGSGLAVLVAVSWPGLLAGSADPPALATAAAQRLPPGTVVADVPLAGGGFARGLEIDLEGGTLRVRGAAGWRAFPGVDVAGPPRARTLRLGTDHQGRDVLARVVAGARTSLTVALAAAAIGGWLGLVVGTGLAWAPRPVAAGIEWVNDGLLGLPRLLLLLILGTALRGSAWGIGLAVGATSWMGLSRLVAAEVRALLGREFVVAVRATGGSGARLAVRHLLPNVLPLVGTALPLLAVDAILLESTLAFLGIPTQTGADSWGAVIADGRRLLPGGWWMTVVPGVLLLATALLLHRLSATLRAAPGRTAGRESA